jgi:hypothetical protein
MIEHVYDGSSSLIPRRIAFRTVSRSCAEFTARPASSSALISRTRLDSATVSVRSSRSRCDSRRSRISFSTA